MCCTAMPLKKLCPPETCIILPNNAGWGEAFFHFYFMLKKMKFYDVIMPHGCGKLVAVRVQFPLTDLNVKF